MSVHAYFRGHAAHCHRGQWYYDDNGQPVNDDRPCPRCGKSPTPEGYDACRGYIPGAYSACCGHGKERGYVVEEEA